MILVVLSLGFHLNASEPENRAASQTPWQLTGQWQQMPLRTEAMKDAGLFGGEGFQCVFEVQYAPSDPSRVYTLVDTSQVWRSDDAGSSWKCMPNGFHSNGGTSLSVDPKNKEVVFVASSTGNRFSSPKADGIYRTLNGGENWTQVFQTQYDKCKPTNNHGNYFIFIPASFDGTRHMTIYAGTLDQGILKSTDGGNSWENIIPVAPLGAIKDIKTNPNSKELELWVSSTKGLFIVRKIGDTFKLEKVNMAEKNLPVDSDNFPSQIYFSPKNNQIVYAVCGYQGFYKSYDGGKTFAPKNKGLKHVRYKKNKLVGLSMSPANPNWLTVMFNRLGRGNFMSRDGGETWQYFTGMDQGNLSQEIWASSDKGGANYFYRAHPCGFHPTDPNTAIIPGRQWALERTTDQGQTWKFCSNGFTGARAGVGRSNFSFPTQYPQTNAFFLIDYGIVLSQNKGESWRNLQPPRTLGAITCPVGAICPSNDNLIVSASGHWKDQKLIISHNQGKQWDVALDKIDNFSLIQFHPQQHHMIYAGRYRSDDFGKTWKELKHTVVAVFQKDGDIIYGKSKKSNTIHLSKNKGEDWSPLKSPPIKGKEVAIDPSDYRRIYIASNHGVYIYENEAWLLKQEDAGLNKDFYGTYSFRNIATDPNHPNLVYLTRLSINQGKRGYHLGHSDGVFVSLDKGKTWQNISNNLGNHISLWSVAVDPRHDRIYVGSSHGTWYMDNVTGKK
ncbi:hypothetical protein JYU15_01865 [bacterium AH-315-I18]|nr:hypothetical protein [bacterium AH-315-I18]